MYCVIIHAEFPAPIGPFRSQERAQEIADRWNAEHDTEEYGTAIVETLLTYEQAEREF